MGVIVSKFGGTSLADANQIRKAQAIVLANPQRRYVVPSAPGKRTREDQKITDLLYLCHAHSSQGLPVREVFEVVSNRYRAIVADLGLRFDINEPLAEIEKAMTAGASADYCASRGEYLNGLIIAELLGFEFVDAAEVIHFDKHGRFLPDVTQDVMSNRLSKCAKAVIPGFYGSTSEGQIKTFSRGGSDITGSIVARGVNADVYENWTDVSGLLMADPRIVSNPRTIDVVTYRELRELAYMGASVLHDEAIFPVRQAGIPINIRNTNDPKHPGTMIVASSGDRPRSLGRITGIAGRKDFTIIAIEKALMNAEIGCARRLLEVLETNQISLEHMPTGIDTVSVVVSDKSLEGRQDKVLEEIRLACKPDALEVYPNMALIATVGRGMAHTPGMAARLFTALAEAGVNVRMIDQGSSELNIIVGIEERDFEAAVRTIYAAFVD